METKKAHSSEKLTFLIENSVKIVTIYFKKYIMGQIFLRQKWMTNERKVRGNNWKAAATTIHTHIFIPFSHIGQDRRGPRECVLKGKVSPSFVHFPVVSCACFSPVYDDSNVQKKAPASSFPSFLSPSSSFWPIWPRGAFCQRTHRGDHGLVPSPTPISMLGTHGCSAIQYAYKQKKPKLSGRDSWGLKNLSSHSKWSGKGRNIEIRWIGQMEGNEKGRKKSGFALGRKTFFME